MKILKTLRKPYLAIFLAQLMLFISCSESSNLIDSEKLNVTDEQVIEIGQMHNTLLNNSLEFLAKNENLKNKRVVSNQDIRAELKAFFLNELEVIENEELKQYFVNLINDNSFGSQEFIENQTSDVAFKDYLNNIQNILDNNLSDNEFENLKSQAILDSNLSEKESILISIEVAKQSNNYWTGTDTASRISGFNKISEINNSFGTQQYSFRNDVDYVSADYKGAAGGSLGVAVVGTAVALSGGILSPFALLGIAVAAAWSSATAAY